MVSLDFILEVRDPERLQSEKEPFKPLQYNHCYDKALIIFDI